MGVVTFRLPETSKLAEARAWAQYIKVATMALWCGIFAAPFALWALFWTSPDDYPYLSSMLFVPMAVGGCVLLFMPVWRGDRFAKLLLGAGIGFRLAAAGAYIWTGFVIYGAVDAFHYWSVGLQLVQQFSSIGWEAFQPPYLSTNLIANICGIVMLVTGNALPTLFVVFALAALWGGYFFYSAFCIAFPQGNRGLYGLLVILLPSIVYWSSAIGKDALEQLFIGIGAFGFARIVRKLDVAGIVVCVIGVAGAAAVRPHIGAMLALSMLVPFALGKTKGGWMALSVKLLLIPILAASTFMIVQQAETFVGVESSDVKGNVEALKQRHGYTSIGGSAFNEGESSLPKRIILGPFLPFRPFPWEVHNVMSAFSALEGLALLVWVWRRRREFWQVVRNWREPYIGFILAFALQFSLVFAAAISNFGILARQRIMLLPLVLMLLCAKASTRNLPASGALRRDPRFPSPLPAPHLGRSLS